jgi:hypothetical protein
MLTVHLSRAAVGGMPGGAAVPDRPAPTPRCPGQASSSPPARQSGPRVSRLRVSAAAAEWFRRNTPAPVFKLSQDFPKAKPETLPHVLGHRFQDRLAGPTMSAGAHTTASKAIPDHPISRRISTPENQQRCGAWYTLHAPFQHWGPSGREGVHGIDQGGRSEGRRPWPSQQNLRRAEPTRWGCYNDLAGYTLAPGSWNADDPGGGLCRVTVPGRRGKTVVQGPLRSNVPPAQVSEAIANPLQWNAYITKTSYPDAAAAPFAMVLGSLPDGHHGARQPIARPPG